MEDPNCTSNSIFVGFRLYFSWHLIRCMADDQSVSKLVQLDNWRGARIGIYKDNYSEFINVRV